MTPTATVLVPRQPPAFPFARIEEPVTSIEVSPELDDGGDREGLCFRVLSRVLAGEEIRLTIREVPRVLGSSGVGGTEEPGSRGPEDPLDDVAVVMPHRGREDHLQAALASVSRADCAPRTYLGRDVEGVGHFVILQQLIERAAEPFLVFHDSDDVSCADRFTTLRAAFDETGADRVGSHELRVDEIEGTVRPVRFPLDVNAALAVAPGFAQLHPTTMVRREAFLAAGGFSTHHRFANDTQFLYRSFFSMRLRNVDGFLYVRRRHPGAVTVRPETALGSPLREAIEAEWMRDFEEVKAGRLALAESSLRVIRGAP